MVEVVLRAGRERAVLRRHPWILSGAIARVVGHARPGDWARVVSADGRTLGHGHYSPSSQIRVRMFVFGEEVADGDAILGARVRSAIERRQADPLLAATDAVRWVNAEGDHLPGLVVDRFRDVLVVKLTTAGMFERRSLVARVLEEVSRATCGIARGDQVAARHEGVDPEDRLLWGEPPAGPVWIEEDGRRYAVDVTHGQKTGFYLDQRDARDLASKVSGGRDVLDLYAHSGGFSVAAALGGARSIKLVESSRDALELARANMGANAPRCAASFVEADVHRFLREDRESYDLIFVDPPPLAKSKRDVDKASRAYKDALLYALLRSRVGALVLAFSCSHHVGPELFRKIVFGASIDAKRTLQVLRTLGPPVDHPVSIDHPEGAYLTGLFLRVTGTSAVETTSR